jgi:preprotein translocase subunit SecF
MQEIQELKKELENIKQRNVRVEADKAWETSLFRKISIAITTYIIASVVMYFIGVSDFLLNALIPTIGYLLSTLSLPFIKDWWIKKYLRRF